MKADFETPVMASVGDSADDSAIYIDENGSGFIAGTDKQAGLYIYNLDGTQRDFFPVGMINNVDLREGYGRYVLLVASNDEDNNITSMLYDPVTDSFGMANKMPVTPSPYGICLGKVDGQFHVGVTTKAGQFYQYAIIEQRAGGMGVSEIREVKVGTQIEGCVFDDRTGQLYIAEENGGLFVYASHPDNGDSRTEITRVGQNGLMADLEGVTLYPQGEDGGYLLVSSQGNDTYGVFDLPSHAFIGQFEIVEGVVDRTSVTDGIDVTSKATPQFPNGFFVVQDNQQDETTPEDQEKQNFKIIDWRKIETGLTP